MFGKTIISIRTKSKTFYDKIDFCWYLKSGKFRLEWPFSNNMKLNRIMGCSGIGTTSTALDTAPQLHPSLKRCARDV